VVATALPKPKEAPRPGSGVIAVPIVVAIYGWLKVFGIL
jgi:hypothetical protein